MLFKTDENLPQEAAALLCVAGHDALSVYDQNLAGSNDGQLIDVCRREGRILVTLDLDFADIRSFPPTDYPGLIVLRLVRQDSDSVLSVLGKVTRAMESESPAAKLWIVEEDRIRVRG